MLKQIFLTCMCLVTAIGIPFAVVSAHGTGVSYEESKDGYFMDIGHDEFIAEGESTRFDFTVYPEDVTTVEGEVFTDVWVTITQDKKLFFAGGVHKPVFGATGFTYVFPEEGTFTVSARFQNEGQTVVETSFPLEILPPLETETSFPPLWMNILFAGVGLIVGVTIGLFIPRKKNKIQ